MLINQLIKSHLKGSIAYLDRCQMTPDQAVKSILDGGVANLMLSNILDADETVFFARELEFFKKTSYDVIYPEYKADFFCPPDFSADTGSDKITYEQYDTQGEANVINDESQDYPNAETSKKQFSNNVKTLGVFTEYGLQEIRRSTQAQKSGLTATNKSIQQRKLESAVKALLEKQEKIICIGDDTNGLTGFFNNKFVPSHTPTVDKALGTLNNDELSNNIIGLVNSIVSQSNGTFVPDTIVLPIPVMLELTKRRIQNTSENLLSYIQRSALAHWNVKFVSYARIDTAASAGKHLCFAYKRTPEVVEHLIPQPMEVFPPQQLATSYKIFLRMRTGGVQVRYPIAMAKMELIK